MGRSVTHAESVIDDIMATALVDDMLGKGKLDRRECGGRVAVEPYDDTLLSGIVPVVERVFEYLHFPFRVTPLLHAPPLPVVADEYAHVERLARPAR